MYLIHGTVREVKLRMIAFLANTIRYWGGMGSLTILAVDSKYI